MGKPQLERGPFRHRELRLEPGGRIDAPDASGKARIESDPPPERAPRHGLMDLLAFPRSGTKLAPWSRSTSTILRRGLDCPAVAVWLIW
jgi:hypothetical protein